MQVQTINQGARKRVEEKDDAPQSFTSSSENVKVRAQMQEIRFRLRAGTEKTEKNGNENKSATSG